MRTHLHNNINLFKKVLQLVNKKTNYKAIKQFMRNAFPFLSHKLNCFKFELNLLAYYKLLRSFEDHC